MKFNKITVALDAAIPSMGIAAGHKVAFTDGLPTADDGLAFYISQLAHLESTIYETKYTAINYQEMIPIITSVPEWADSWDYVSFDAATMGEFVGSSADDLPSISLNAHKTSVKLGYAGNSFSYSLDELRKSQQLRIPVDSTMAKAAFKGAQQHSQRIAYFGDAQRGMTGLFNNKNLALDSSSINWKTASGKEIVDDINGLLTKVWIDSANTHLPNALALPSDRYALIASRPMSDQYPNKSILQYLQETNLYTTMTGLDLRIFPRIQLQTASESGGGRMLAYELNEENLGMCNPIPWRPLAPQAKDLSIRVPCEYKISGCEFRYPFSGAYRDFEVEI